MFKSVLIATDGSELSGKVVAAGLALAKSLGARVVAVTATEPWTQMMNGEGMAFDFPIEEYDKACAEHAGRILASVRSAAESQGMECDTRHATDFPAEAILATAKNENCDLIVMASHGRRGISRLLLGSQTTRVITLSTVPVLVCR